jgi:ethanolamine utilization protein EutQ (cupin superfamily)
VEQTKKEEQRKKEVMKAVLSTSTSISFCSAKSVKQRQKLNVSNNERTKKENRIPIGFVRFA